MGKDAASCSRRAVGLDVWYPATKVLACLHFGQLASGLPPTGLADWSFPVSSRPGPIGDD